ncbi:conserved hypothetical protein [Leishmania mexicana MHOM/GT/2001/U1103]|uniref:non-specific serine/threonine protein kinase n=1 Tax=Leishmania mexicana (strain MHOM/GT/2001/U1103) TaxID=929439 RepID=E9AZY5_LEIMU|nr:conserved hypothetical protein [Leishmania mexicana MHOM/GT/2001/U1103]CBZ28536.1 conserved hypothetical protein [Leishmania mexicana MHOM/GT/2001/U1103]
MIRKKVLSIGNNSATLLVQDTEAGGALRVLRRMNVAGWAAEEVSTAVRMYEELHKRRLRGFVPIHTVLIQSSFLSVVASYASEGDVTTLIEEEEHSSLEEASVLRWLCACALAIRQLHLHNLFFPGLTGDRLFLDHHTGGTANLLLGVPLPLPVYYSQLQERKKSGVRVELDYPPEVLAAPAAHPNGGGEGANHSTRSGSGYHPTLSDVWCLGRLGVVLLTAKGTNIARRSGTARQLLSRMMADEPATRPSMESVVQSLVALAGTISLGQPPWPSHPATAPSTTSAQVASASSAPAIASRQPHIAASGSTGGSAATVVQSATAENRSAGGGASKAQCTTKGASSRPPSSTTSSTPPDVPSTRVHNSQRHPAETPATVEHSSPPPPMSAPTPHLDHPGRPTHAPDDSWYRRAGAKFELLQRMNASPPKQHAFIGGGETPQGTSRGEHGHHHLRGSTSNLRNTKSPSPRHNSRGGLIDHNTRVLDEIFAEQGELLRKAGIWPLSPRRRVDDAKQFQRETLRQLRLETAARQQEMRKHFTEWQRQNNQRLTDADNVDVIDQDGIVIVAPRSAPPHEFLPVATAAPAAESEEMGAGVEPPKSRAQLTEDAQSEASPCQTPLPASPPPPNSTSRPLTPRAKTPAGGSNSAAAVNAYSTRYSGNMPRPSHTFLSTQEAYGARSAGFSALPLRGATSPRLPSPPPNPVQPYSLRSNDSSGHVTSPSSDGDDRPMHSADGGGRSVLKSSTDVGTLSAVEWTIDGIRSTLRALLRNRNLYGETMQEVALFISQPEEARLAARANEIFMKRLRKLLRDDALFFSAVPLCAQLAALEGLEHTLRDSSSGRPSRQRY